MRYRRFCALCPVLGLLLLFSAPHGAHAGGALETSGDVLQLALPAAAAGVALGLGDWQGVWQLGESLAVTLGATYGLKYSVIETRPDGRGEDSFPSGHTSTSFSAAEFLRKRYGWEYGLPAYAVAALVGCTRVASLRHYTHDVLAGAAIGIASSYAFTRTYEGWKVAAEGDSEYLGLRLSRSW